MKSQCKNCPSGNAVSSLSQSQDKNGPTKQDTGLLGLEHLVDLYLVQKKHMAMLNRLAQAKSKDFESPLITASAILMARQYISLIQRLGTIIPNVTGGVFSNRMEMNRLVIERDHYHAVADKLAKDAASKRVTKKKSK